ncbi:hypothetical protein GIB67_028236 [Kingdonia uniflora]|uniref:Uncharacterized protein n=1 Tax=Kingdonia uniflora TaxID=39325 RepID=A0A7J7KZ65_9MAGN|nr:hypothetical protein GIB67_028236 [Kingdonia uniflora]
MGGHGAHVDKPYYLHAKHMYNLDRMKYQRVKMPIFVFTCFCIGVVVPPFLAKEGCIYLTASMLLVVWYEYSSIST